MRFDGVTVDTDTAPGAYLSSGWINGLVEGSVKDTSINDLAAATAQATAGEWVFRIGAVRIGSSMYRLIFADRNNGTAIDQALAQTLQSFRRLSAAELARLNPLRIDVLTVGEADSIDALAGKMEGTERKLELFRLLNGISPGDVLVAGQTIKIVVD
jgi:predicted Zn-dependent protease